MFYFSWPKASPENLADDMGCNPTAVNWSWSKLFQRQAHDHGDAEGSADQIGHYHQIIDKYWIHNVVWGVVFKRSPLIAVDVNHTKDQRSNP
jgi:hypothetical protein